MNKNKKNSIIILCILIILIALFCYIKHKITEITKNNNMEERIVTQLVYFNNFLEEKLLNADINCYVLATYNNIKLNKSELELNDGFPETEGEYKEKCRSAYLIVLQEEHNLIAEPELVEIREKLTEYIQEVKTIAIFALEGGYDAAIIDKYGKNVDQLRLEIREYILKAKRHYDVDN